MTTDQNIDEHGSPAQPERTRRISEIYYHPDHEAMFGEFDYDLRGFLALKDAISRCGVVEPIIVTWRTPGLRDYTILSELDRAIAAMQVRLKEIGVLPVTFGSKAEADEAYLLLNLPVEPPNQWVLSTISYHFQAVQSALANARQQAGGPGRKGIFRSTSGEVLPQRGMTLGDPNTVGCDTRTLDKPQVDGTDPIGSARDITARTLHQSRRTTELRRALVAGAMQQNPAEPSESLIARALVKAGPRDLARIARVFGILPPVEVSERTQPEPIPVSAAPPATDRYIAATIDGRKVDVRMNDLLGALADIDGPSEVRDVLAREAERLSRMDAIRASVRDGAPVPPGVWMAITRATTARDKALREAVQSLRLFHKAKTLIERATGLRDDANSRVLGMVRALDVALEAPSIGAPAASPGMPTAPSATP